MLLTTTITHAELDYNHAPNAFKLDLSSPLATPLTASKITLDNLTADTQIPASKLTVTTSTDGLHISISVHDLVDANNVPLSTVGRADVLPNGWFKLSISKFDVPSLAADYSYQAFYLAGDTAGVGGTPARDGYVDDTDIDRMTDASVIDYDHGDFNYDASIDQNDYAIMDLAYHSGVGTPPAALPDGTVAAARVAGTANIAINWNADAVTDETGWRIQRSIDGGQTFDSYWNVNDTAHLTGTNVSVNDPDIATVPQGQYIYYRIRAYGNGQDTSYTPKQRAISYFASPTPLSRSTYGVTDTTATVRFTDNSIGETGFTAIAFNSDDPDNDFVTITLPAHTGTGPISAHFTGLSPLAVYYVTVRAFNSVGNYSGYGASPSFLAFAPPDAVTATRTGATEASLSFTYDDPDSAGIAGYELYRTNLVTNIRTFIADASPGDVTVDDTLAEGSSYSYDAVAISDDVPTEPSAVVDASKVTTAPTAPTLDAASTYILSGSKATVQFQDHSAGESGFTLKFIPTNASLPTITTTLPAHTGTGTTTGEITGLTTWTDYNVSIAAFKNTATTTPTTVPSTTQTSTQPVNSDGNLQTASWVTEYWYGAPNGAAWGVDGVTTTTPGSNSGYEGLGERTETYTVDSLPKHTYRQVTIQISPIADFSSTASSKTLQLKVNGQTVHTWHGGDASDLNTYYSGYVWSSGGEFNYGDPDDSGIQADQGKSITVSIIGDGFSSQSTHDWYVDYLKISTYFPEVSITGQGSSLEGIDYGGTGPEAAAATSGGYFTVVRSGSAATSAQPLTVDLLPRTGSHEDGVADPDTEFKSTNQATIPAGQLSINVPVIAQHNDLYNALNAFESVQKNDSSYLRLTEPSAPPQVNSETAKVQVRFVNISEVTVTDGATQQGIDTNVHQKDWAALKEAGNFVFLKALLRGGVTESDFPSGDLPEGMISWTGGESVPGGSTLERRLDKDSSRKVDVSAQVGGSSDGIDVWIMWSTVTIQTSGLAPVGAKNFAQFGGGPDIQFCGPLTYVDDGGNLIGQGRMAATVQLTPAGVGQVVKGGWDIKRDRIARLLRDESHSSQWDLGWTSDDSGNDEETLEPDADDRLYSIDAPNIGKFGAFVASEIFANFKEYLEWFEHLASDKDAAPWHYHAKWELVAVGNEKIDPNDVGPNLLTNMPN